MPKVRSIDRAPTASFPLGVWIFARVSGFQSGIWTGSGRKQELALIFEV